MDGAGVWCEQCDVSRWEEVEQLRQRLDAGGMKVWLRYCTVLYCTEGLAARQQRRRVSAGAAARPEEQEGRGGGDGGQAVRYQRAGLPLHDGRLPEARHGG